MAKSRRHFLATTSLGLLGAAVAIEGQTPNPAELPPGAPPAFGTSPAAGPEVSPATFAEAEKLVQIELTAANARWRPEAGGKLWHRSTNGAPVHARLRR